MNPKPSTGFEIPKDTPERVTIIGPEMPRAYDMYDILSDEKDILVYADAQSTSVKGRETILKSERELFDDLLEFCSRCRELPADDEDSHGYAKSIRNTDAFLDSMTYLSKEMYTEAVQGLAARHTEWLAQNSDMRLLFAVPDLRSQRSQNLVARDIANSINPDEADRVTVAYVGELTVDMLGDDTKVVLSDDWSVMGSHIANDISQVLHRARTLGIDTRAMEVEVNLLLARTDQIDDGIHTIQRLLEDLPDAITREPQTVAYFEAPVVKQSFDEKASPTGSHSSVDYGFSETLSAMLVVASRHGVATRMPYIAEIIPKYSYDYEHKLIDKNTK